MAKILGKREESAFLIKEFLGINESADGDTQLKLGEASDLRNWQVTSQYHLRVRPGYRVLRQFQGPVRGLWTGYVAGEKKMVVAADGGVWELTPLSQPAADSSPQGEPLRRIGDISDAPTTMFGFGGKVYFLNGREYLVWDGQGFADTVDGYVPLVVTAAKPAGGGITVENINRLTGRRRCRFSADGTSREYHLPEGKLLAVEQVEVDGERISGWTADPENGIVTFDEAPQAGTSNVEIRYAAQNTLRALVEGMRFAEQFNGAADSRVFLYGDGSARAIYCGVTEEGKASAEYFPDLYEIQVGSENAPITAMIKYYDRLMTYKADGGAYATQYEAATLADGSVIPGFLTVSTHRELGNEAPGQVRLVKNVPRTLYGGNLYDWVMVNYGTRDERNAKLISQRIQNSLGQADPEKVFAFDDDTRQEYYLFLNDGAGTALVHNYQIDVWYRYTGLPVTCAGRMDGRLIFGMADGRVAEFHERFPNDDGQVIDAFFASGHMAFDRDYRRKDCATFWVSVKPTANANLAVTVRTDRRSDYGEKTVSMSLSTFQGCDFGRWSFLTNRAPQMERLRLKVKRAVYCQLVLKSDYAASDATVLGVDIKTRYGGFVK